MVIVLYMRSPLSTEAHRQRAASPRTHAEYRRLIWNFCIFEAFHRYIPPAGSCTDRISWRKKKDKQTKSREILHSAGIPYCFACNVHILHNLEILFALVINLDNKLVGNKK